MQTLPIEIIGHIVLYISKITDKRQFTQTCKICNTITYPIIKNQKSKIRIKQFKKPIRSDIERFTLELCYDSYFNMIPNSYLNPKNNIIVKALTIYGQVELLKQAMDNGCKLFTEITEKNNNSCIHAIISGNINMLKFVRLHGCQCDAETLNIAAHHNEFDMVKFLYEEGCVISNCAGEYASCNGNIIILKWLIENGMGLNVTFCRYAARFGHLELLKILRNDHNCSWDYLTTNGAAIGGHLDVLQWSIDNGCEFDYFSAYISAKLHHRHNVAEWIDNNGYLK